ncbi:protein angel homolog 1 isoform X2 [Tachysurus fulvidraco]|uniref:protein angel homolog 1 isoform X2 n=1 Tax=Tachysurus fulvidraco TaxID=1234273 RepID=UPI001FEE4DB7|nr:protein angel homolog 1 isoform X2 [Tachysurus fulvidraco]
MIGSLIYYGLYPLTQFLTRLSESWWTRHQVIINGKAVCDGGAGSYRRFNERQTALLDQWCNAGTEDSETSTHTLQERSKAERLVESRSLLKIREVVVEQKSEMEQDKGKIPSVDLMDPNPESVIVSISERTIIQPAADESKSKSSSEKERQRVQWMVTETGSDCQFMPAAGFSYPLGSNKAAPSSTLIHSAFENHNLLKSPQESQAFTKRNAAFEPTADGAEENENNGCKVQVQLTSGLFTSENMYCDDFGTRGTEAQVGNGSLMYDLSALLADNDTQSFTNHAWLQPVPTGMLREWEDLGKTSSPCRSPKTTSVDPGSKFDFTVMSYNILAQDLLEANPELYVHCSEDVLAWENRLQNILKELQIWEPEIICLQEVQENHFYEQMYPALIERGFECVYKRRTGTKTDGCAVCYNTKCFTLLSVRLLEFQRHDCELLDRDNVGIVLLLQPNTTHGEGIRFSPICVANTHLLFNPRRGDVKLAQLAIVLAEIDSIVREYKVKGLECEIILCGDFNSLPNTPLYNLIVMGRLYYHGLPNWMVSGQEDLSFKTHHRRLYAPLWPKSLGINDNCQYYDACESQGKESGKLQYNHDFLRQLRYCPAACVRPPDLELIPGVTDNTPTPEETQPFPPRHFRNVICHGFNLSSVYNQNISDTERCAVTTLHSHGAAMVDYIFYSTRGGHRGYDDKEKGLKLLGRLSLPCQDDLWMLNGLPNKIFPSDHLSLLASFQLC